MTEHKARIRMPVRHIREPALRGTIASLHADVAAVRWTKTFGSDTCTFGYVPYIDLEEDCDDDTDYSS